MVLVLGRLERSEYKTIVRARIPTDYEQCGRTLLGLRLRIMGWKWSEQLVLSLQRMEDHLRE